MISSCHGAALVVDSAHGVGPASEVSGLDLAPVNKKQRRRQTGKEACKQETRQARKQAGEHLEGIQLEPCPVGVCFKTVW